MSDKEDKRFISSNLLPYRIFPPSLQPTIWPLVIVNIPEFKDPLNQDIYALIDSGANNSILDKQIALRMGVDFNKCEKYKNGLSVNSSFEYWILNEPIYVKVEGIEFPVTFQVIDSNETTWPMILGEDTIFKYAEIVFRKYKKEFVLKFLKELN